MPASLRVEVERGRWLGGWNQFQGGASDAARSEPRGKFAVHVRMIERVKKDVAKMKKSAPGERFVKQHERAKKSGLASGAGRVVCVGLAVVAIAIGVVLVFIPGPAFVFFLLAGALLASQWRLLAEWMDAAELKLRDVWSALRRKWRKRSPASRQK